MVDPEPHGSGSASSGSRLRTGQAHVATPDGPATRSAAVPDLPVDPRWQSFLQAEARACQAGAGDECSEAGRTLSFSDGVKDSSADPDVRVANQYLQRGCDLGVARSCGFLASNLITTDGRTDADLQAAHQLYVRGCALGDAEHCEIAGLHSDLESSRAFFARGCELRSIFACFYAAERAESRPAALQFAARGCALAGKPGTTQGTMGASACGFAADLSDDADERHVFEAKACELDAEQCARTNSRR
jgi:hypothetical protein